MMANKIYSAKVDYEKKLQKVMERLQVEKHNYDWTRQECFIEFTYRGQLYRFEHSIEKARANGQKINFVSDLFAQLVTSLEDIARMTERGIYELSAWIEGMKALPAAKETPICFVVLGFTEMPKSTDELKRQYKLMAKAMHPDTGGDANAFARLQEAYKQCTDLMAKERESNG